MTEADRDRAGLPSQPTVGMGASYPGGPGGVGLIPALGTNIPHALGHSQKQNKNTTVYQFLVTKRVVLFFQGEVRFSMLACNFWKDTVRMRGDGVSRSLTHLGVPAAQPWYPMG